MSFPPQNVIMRCDGNDISWRNTLIRERCAQPILNQSGSNMFYQRFRGGNARQAPLPRQFQSPAVLACLQTVIPLFFPASITWSKFVTQWHCNMMSSSFQFHFMWSICWHHPSPTHFVGFRFSNYRCRAALEEAQTPILLSSGFETET